MSNQLKEEKLKDFFDEGGVGTRQYSFLNWRFSPHDSIEVQFCNLAEGYFEVANNLIEQCLDNNNDRKADIWIFPILFNIVHAVELYLKAINSMYPIYFKLKGFVLDELPDSKIEGDHDIKQMCQTAISKVRNDSDRDPDLYKALKEVLQFINIIYKYSDDVAFTRYPLPKDAKSDLNKEYFYVSHKNVTINMVELHKWVKKISNNLYNITGFLIDMIDELNGYRNEVIDDVVPREEYYYE